MGRDEIHVVVIDDDYEDYLILKDLLSDVRGTRYRTEWISSSQEGLHRIRQQEADVYLLDYHLDSRTGLDILEEVNKENLRRPLILLTAQGDYSVDLAAMQKGASDYLSKTKLSSDLLERSIRYSIKRAQDQVQLEENQKLKLGKEVAELANKTKSEFLAYISHEIKNPLSTILGLSELSQDPETTEAERLHFAAVIHRSAKTLLNLVNDTLDLSRIESGKIEISRDPVLWRSLVHEVIESLKPKATSKGIALNFAAGENLPELILTDPHRFRQILINLLGNALKFTDTGFIDVDCDLDLKGNLVISVQDTGIGIAPEESRHLFTPYGQANSKIHQKYGGTGMGLSISKKLAQALGGDLVLTQSTPGAGSTFTWSLIQEPESALKNQLSGSDSPRV